MPEFLTKNEINQFNKEGAIFPCSGVAILILYIIYKNYLNKNINFSF